MSNKLFKAPTQPSPVLTNRRGVNDDPVSPLHQRGRDRERGPGTLKNQLGAVLAQSFVSLLVIAGLLFITMQPAIAAPEKAQSKPSDLFWENVAIGSLGAVVALSPIAWREYGCVGGISDFMLATKLCQAVPYTGYVTMGIGGLAAIPLGASIAIIWNSARHNYESSIPTTILSTYLGTLAGFGTSIALSYLLIGDRCSDCINNPFFRFFFVSTWIGITSLGAAIGFNNEAELQTNQAAMSALLVNFTIYEIAHKF